MSRKIILASILVLLFAGGLLFLLSRGAGSSTIRPADLNSGRGKLQEQGDFETKRGPRPVDARFPPGFQRIETNEAALAAAQKSLARIIQEMDSETDETKRAVLQQKKELILRTITRFSNKPTE